MNSVVILAGGKSRRMGRDKLSLVLDGLTVLESAVERFRGGFDNVYLSVAEPTKYPEIDVRRIVDVFTGAGPMAGLHAALSSLDVDGVFLVAADLPFAMPDAAKRIIELCGDFDAAILRLPDGRLEPLFGYYKKTLLGDCIEALESGDYKMTVLLTEGATRFVEISELGELWDENMIMNLNFPEDYERLRERTH